jgi:putative transposase
VCRYVERNPLRAKLVERAEDWRWSSLWQREHSGSAAQVLLAEWPVARPADWARSVNQAENEQELARLRQSVTRSQPFGHTSWALAVAKHLGLLSTLRAPGRPRKEFNENGS